MNLSLFQRLALSFVLVDTGPRPGPGGCPVQMYPKVSQCISVYGSNPCDANVAQCSANVPLCGKMYLNVAPCSANIPLNDAERESPGNSGLVPQLWSRRTVLVYRNTVLCCVLLCCVL